jgi:hypothetical protein
LILAGKQEAQMCFSEEEIPNILLPIINKTGIIRPMRGPEIYQGQGCVKTFMLFTLKNSIVNSNAK